LERKTRAFASGGRIGVIRDHFLWKKEKKKWGFFRQVKKFQNKDGNLLGEGRPWHREG